MAGEIDHMLAGAAAHLHAVAGFPGKELLQHGADRQMIAVKRWGVEATVGFDGATILAEFNDIFRHAELPFVGDRGPFALARSCTNRKASNYSTESSYFSTFAGRKMAPYPSLPALSPNSVYALTNYIPGITARTMP
jgi:hypothetical protein